MAPHERIHHIPAGCPRPGHEMWRQRGGKHRGAQGGVVPGAKAIPRLPHFWRIYPWTKRARHFQQIQAFLVGFHFLCDRKWRKDRNLNLWGCISVRSCAMFNGFACVYISSHMEVDDISKTYYSNNYNPHNFECKAFHTDKAVQIGGSDRLSKYKRTYIYI